MLTSLARQHDPYLVVFAAAICLVTASMSAWLLPRARTNPLDYVLASIILALGAWTTHFVAMLGYEPGMRMTFDRGSTAASVIAALAGVAAGLGLWRRVTTWTGTLAAGAIVGLSIIAMHYLGMHAVSIPGTLAYDPVLVACSVAIGAGLGAAALGALRLPPTRRTRIAGAALLLACVVGLHFTGMAAVSIKDGGTQVVHGMARTWLALATGATSLLIATAFVVTTAIKAAALRRQRSHDAMRLREFAQASFEALAICNAAGVVMDANSQLLVLCDAPREDIVGRLLEALFEPSATPLVSDGVGFRNLRNGVPVETQSRRIGSGEGQRSVVALRDVRERLKAEQRIRHMAHHDALTGLANRVVLHERLLTEIARSGRNNSGFAVLYVDLDRFKPINDVHGHAAGDQLLRQVAARLLADLRADDTVARLGGDEFAIIQSGLSRTDPSDTLDLAHRLLERISAPYDLGDIEVIISCSIGIAVYPDDASDADALLRGADIALYRAKHGGRAGIAFFRPEMEEALREQHLLEQDLRLAVGRGELWLAWQPQNTPDGAAVGFEALMRWQHPTRGNVPPDIFIPVAESSNIILQLGAWALRTACAEAVRWANPLRVAVNISPLQVQQADFVEIVEAVLNETRLDPARLELEVTERLFLSETDGVMETLGALKRLGISISLDDFGTGYSSLGTLRRFAFDRIKLDQSFISKMTDDPQAAAIVKAILGLSRGLGLPVVAEGVETASQLGALRDAQCEMIQGFLIGRPQPIAAYANLTQGTVPVAVAA